ncbi:hypothetical protein BDV19DRAFT_401535 [Aspergillus venezuelensis]
MASRQTDYDAIVIGVAFSGIRSLYELLQLGLTVKCIDVAPDVGGTWYYTRYPGSQTDSDAGVYRFNLAPDLIDDWNFQERCPSQEEVQRYLNYVVGRCDLRKYIQFSSRVVSAHYQNEAKVWTIATTDGMSKTCRYFLLATGALSIPKEPPFPGLGSYTGEWYQGSRWPERKGDFMNKRISVVGTGSTGVQLIPKIAPVAKELTVFQRTPNHVLPARKYSIDEYQAVEIRQTHVSTWDLAKQDPAGHALHSPERTMKDMRDDPEEVRQILDNGWEQDCFALPFATFNDILSDSESNAQVSEYVRQKIWSTVHDQETAELLCPTENVNLVDISHDEIDLYENLYEKGICTSTGAEYEFDITIFALGFDAGVGALNALDIKGKKGSSTFAGILVSHFPNMFIVCSPHIPVGNVPVVLDVAVDWVGQTMKHIEQSKLASTDVALTAMERWTDHAVDLWTSGFLAKPTIEYRAWFVGANIPTR